MDKPKILRDKAGREVVKFTTESGVVAVVDTSFSDAAVKKFRASLLRRIARCARENRKRQ